MFLLPSVIMNIRELSRFQIPWETEKTRIVTYIGEQHRRIIIIKSVELKGHETSLQQDFRMINNWP